jgi:hypothetical protein
MIPTVMQRDLAFIYQVTNSPIHQFQREKELDQTGASWDRVGMWLRRLEQLRRPA